VPERRLLQRLASIRYVSSSLASLHGCWQERIAPWAADKRRNPSRVSLVRPSQYQTLRTLSRDHAQQADLKKFRRDAGMRRRASVRLSFAKTSAFHAVESRLAVGISRRCELMKMTRQGRVNLRLARLARRTAGIPRGPSPLRER
jgi:hypothetical protein